MKHTSLYGMSHFKVKRLCFSFQEEETLFQMPFPQEKEVVPYAMKI